MYVTGEGTPAACTWRPHKELRKGQGAAEGIHLCQTLLLLLFVMSTYCTFASAQVFQAIPFYDGSSMHTSNTVVSEENESDLMGEKKKKTRQGSLSTVLKKKSGDT